jgi:hypothetical protein
MQTPEDIHIPPIDNKIPQSDQEAHENWKSQLQCTRKAARKYMLKSQSDQKHQYNKKTAPHKLNVGDIVCKLQERHPSEGYKLTHKYAGTYQILQFTSETNVKLLDLTTNEILPRYIHINKLKKLYFHHKDPSIVNQSQQLNQSQTNINSDHHSDQNITKQTNTRTKSLVSRDLNVSQLVREIDQHSTKDTSATQPSTSGFNANDENSLPQESSRLNISDMRHSKMTVPKTHSMVTRSRVKYDRPSGLDVTFGAHHTQEVTGQRTDEDSDNSEESLNTTENTIIEQNAKFDTSDTDSDTDSDTHSLEKERENRRNEEILVSQDDEVTGDNRETEKSSEVKDTYHPINKVFRKRENDQGEMEYYVQWANQPAKKYNSWVKHKNMGPEWLERQQQRASNTAANTEYNNQKQQEARPEPVMLRRSARNQPIEKDSMIHVPPLVTDTDQWDLDDTAIALEETILASPSDSNTGDLDMTREDDSPFDIVTSTPRKPQYKDQIMNLRMDDRTRVNKLHNGFLYNITCYFKGSQSIQDLLNVEITSDILNALTNIHCIQDSRRDADWYSYNHTCSIFASFHPLDCPIRLIDIINNPPCIRICKTMENAIQFRKAIIGGSHKIAVDCLHSPPNISKRLTQHDSLHMLNLQDWEDMSETIFLDIVARTLTVNPRMLIALLETAGKYMTLLGLSNRWCSGEQSLSTPVHLKSRNIHGNVFVLLREIFILAHTGRYTVNPLLMKYQLYKGRIDIAQYPYVSDYENYEYFNIDPLIKGYSVTYIPELGWFPNQVKPSLCNNILYNPLRLNHENSKNDNRRARGINIIKIQNKKYCIE